MDFASMAETVDIARSKIIVTVGDGDLIADVDVLHGHNFHAVAASGNQTPIGVAVMVGEPSWAQKY
jgi:hypothetical protein